jgi:integrase
MLAKTGVESTGDAASPPRLRSHFANMYRAISSAPTAGSGWPREAPDCRTRRSRIRQGADTLVCACRDGEPLQPQSLTHEFPRFLGRVKDLPRVRFHDLGHNHATLLLAAGEHLKIAQERLGHSMITTTLALYSHVTPTMQEQAAARLDDTFRRAARGDR